MIKPTRAFSSQWLASYRFQTDMLADTLITVIHEQAGMTGLRNLFTWLGKNEDFSSIKTEVWSKEVVIFFEENNQLPTFANPTLIQAGCQFFERNKQAIGLLLGCLSLPYCYAAADGAMVLYLSQRIQQDTRKRLEETGEFIFGVMDEKAWLDEMAINKILKIRLMHAAIRFFTVHSKQWDEAWGEPINQEDMAGTNLAFSYIVIKGLRKTGKSPKEQEAEAFLHLWSVIGYLMGVKEELLPQNLREAFHLDKNIAKRNFKPSEAGRVLTKSLIKTLESFVPNALFKTIPTANMRFLLGDELADMLGIPALEIQKRLVKVIPMSIFFSE